MINFCVVITLQLRRTQSTSHEQPQSGTCASVAYKLGLADANGINYYRIVAVELICFVSAFRSKHENCRLYTLYYLRLSRKTIQSMTKETVCFSNEEESTPKQSLQFTCSYNQRQRTKDKSNKELYQDHGKCWSTLGGKRRCPYQVEP